MMNRVTAVFDSQPQAEQAIQSLRQMGINDANLSIIARHGNETSTSGSGTASHDDGDSGSGAAKGLLGGAGVGALFGLAAALIPGIGPFITAGALASTLGAVGGGMAAGAIVGGTTGAVAGALAKSGYDDHESQYYGSAIEQGGVFVAVDTDGSTVSAQQIQAVLAQYGGHSAGAAGATGAMV
ncbi:MAG TPA: hypothetical protein VM821_02450 [Abditibacteriaceae bacterium]|jgi:hypothetical protein|nr:hypothetical protein [Abditibacteriaceae bacterium]